MIKFLQRMIEFKAKKRVDADPDSFHEFVERVSQYRYFKNRIYEKVRRLKMKYCNNLKRYVKVRKDAGM